MSAPRQQALHRRRHTHAAGAAAALLLLLLLALLAVGSVPAYAHAFRTLTQAGGDSSSGAVSAGASCPPGVPVALCFVQPCLFTTCLAGTTCVDDFCGGCSARCEAWPPPLPAPPAPLCFPARAACNCTQQCCGNTVCVGYILQPAAPAGNDTAAPPSSASSNANAAPEEEQQEGNGDEEEPRGTTLAAANATEGTPVGVCLTRSAVAAARKRAAAMTGRQQRGNLTVFAC